MLRRFAVLAYRYAPLPRRLKLAAAHLVFRLSGSTFAGSELYERWKQPLKPRPARAALERRVAAIELPRAASPTVSIVIPTCGNVAYALACLESIASHPPRASTEVLLVEDASGDPLMPALRGIRGLRFVQNETNLGYLRACNRAAQLAHGRYLHLLNDDTEVTAGWLDALLEVFERFPDCGAADSMLLYPDGRLQEAGAVVGPDGRESRIGLGDDPRLPAYNRLRTVDYCSGASLLVHRQIFIDLGMFDERYAPAYYEDVDLAFRLRNAGLQVYYQPASRVVHHGGVSYPSDPRRHAASRARFLERWGKELISRPSGERRSA